MWHVLARRSNRWHQTLRDLRGGGAAGSKPGKFKKKEGIGEMGGQSNSQDRRQLSSLCLGLRLFQVLFLIILLACNRCIMQIFKGGYKG
eukprot:574392-Amorphochlora_amoeboformis.AAC.1